MSTNPLADPAIRSSILSAPEILLDDADIMRALAGANEIERGENVIDLRTVAMDRVRARLDRLEETHRTVIAAAYDNVAGTNMIHRAILDLLEAEDVETFLAGLDGAVAAALRVDTARLILESDGCDETEALNRMSPGVSLAEPGYCALYLGVGAGGAPRAVTLHRMDGGDPRIHGASAHTLRSEACLHVDLGPDRLPGMLVLASAEAAQFAPGQGTDLLAFFAGVFERALLRHLG